MRKAKAKALGMVVELQSALNKVDVDRSVLPKNYEGPDGEPE